MRHAKNKAGRSARQFSTPFVWLKRTVSQDADYGNSPETFTASGTLWGSVRPLGSSERLAEGAQAGLADVEIRLHNLPAVLAVDRLQDPGGTVWVLDGVQPNGERTELVIRAHSYAQPR